MTLFAWKRHYTTGRRGVDSPLGFGYRHLYERRLVVRLHKAVLTNWDGEKIEFPRFEAGEDTAKNSGYVLRRVAPGRYEVSYLDEPVMGFFGGEFDRVYALKKLHHGDQTLDLTYDPRGAGGDEGVHAGATPVRASVRQEQSYYGGE